MPAPFETPTRRGFLRRSGATLAAGLAAVGAGCNGLPPLGSRVRYGSVDAPAPGEATYREWLPAPSALPEPEYGDGEHYHVGVYVSDDDGDPHEAASIARSLVAHVADYAGLHLDDADLAVVGSSVAVLLGDVDPATARDALADTGYEPDGSYAGFELFARSDTGRVLGVRDGAVLCASGERARAELHAVVDARNGDEPLYVDRDADFDALTAHAGLRQWALLQPGSDGAWDGHETPGGDATDEDSPVGWGTGFDSDDRGVYFVETFVFPAGADVTEGHVKRRLDDRGRAVESSAVDVEIDGRVATVEMHLTREQYRTEVSGEPLVAPHVTWGVTHDADADRLTVRHEAGDPVRTDWLSVNGARPEPITSFDGVGNRVEPGDELTVSTAEARDGATARLVYRAPDGSASTTLFDYELP